MTPRPDTRIDSASRPNIQRPKDTKLSSSPRKQPLSVSVVGSLMVLTAARYFLVHIPKDQLTPLLLLAVVALLCTGIALLMGRLWAYHMARLSFVLCTFGGLLFMNNPLSRLLGIGLTVVGLLGFFLFTRPTVGDYFTQPASSSEVAAPTKAA